MPSKAATICTAITKQFEGFSATPYWDPYGKVWTVGYGSIWVGGDDVTPVTQDMPAIDEATAAQWLANELDHTCAPTIAKYVTVPLNDNQTAALLDFIYNEGPHAFITSTLLRLLNQGDTDGAASQFTQWVYAGGKMLNGLVRRRAAERTLFLTIPEGTPAT